MSVETVGFRLFGGVEADRGGLRVDIGHARQQCVLAVLLVEANNTVSVDELIDRVWAGEPPARAREGLQTYVARLRRALPDVPITRNGASYLVTVEENAIDLHRFRALAAMARETEDPALFEQALALSDGELLTGLDVPWAHGLRAAVEKERAAIELDHIDVELAHGRHSEVLAMLAVRVEQRPLDERLAGQYLLALYRAGRQAEALNHYESVRGRLVEELGIDPGRDLRDVHQRILVGEGGPEQAESPVTNPVPRQLPAAPRSFSGRSRDLGRLTTVMDRAAAPGGTVVISAIGGTGGIGKTWLTLHWAHQHSHRFPDGQLFVNLRGFDPSGEPTSPQDAIRGFLDALSVEPSTIPVSFDAQTALYRSLVSGKRMLILLDNAADTGQVVPLLPGSPSCTVLVTSRDRMIGLVNTHGAQPLSLDTLPEAEARALLANRLGPDRLDREPEAVDALIACCAGLPLALSIVAGRALEHPDFPLGELAAELQQATDRLAALDEDPVLSVRSVLSWSYAALTEEQATVFGLLGLAPGPDIGVTAVANLAGLSTGLLRPILRALERISLVQQHVPGRYRMHDLVRLYAAEQARADEGATAAALRRLIDFYLHSAFAAQRLLDLNRPVAITLDAVPAGCVPLTFDDGSTARAWLDTERECLVACGPLSIDNGWYLLAYQFAWTLDLFLTWRGPTGDGILVWQCALSAVQHLRDRAMEARVERRLGTAYGRMREFDKAIAHAERSLAIARDLGDLEMLGQSTSALGLLWEQQGDYRTAREYASAAMGYFTELGNELLAARARSSVAWLSALLGEYDRAESECLAALEVSRSYHDKVGDVLDSLGYIAHQRGRLDQAIDYYEQALRSYHELGESSAEANTLRRIGEVYVTRGEPERARSAFSAGLALFQAGNQTTDADRMRRLIDELDQQVSA
ncbi:MAG TPA: BTAD domain-containing putative transcriptional regulator [Pseudonocardiaceae bacterium]|nr:BTAD domain-containing putative transcriptional regulator [Pseudonocardiaceae bacterium]